jgi:hypothetical protein
VTACCSLYSTLTRPGCSQAMPLLFPDSAQSPQAILDQAKNATADKPHYLVFFASVDPNTGKPWCPGQSPSLLVAAELRPSRRWPGLAAGDRRGKADFEC